MEQFSLVGSETIVSIDINGIAIPVERVASPIITDYEVMKRPEGYGLPGFISGSVTATLGNITAEGFGDAPEDTCELKATSEALERLVLKKLTYKNQTTETSSGWACHPIPEVAIENAILELTERDVALTNWENGGPFFEVPEALWPKEVINWKRQQSNKIEFSILKIYLSKASNGCCISALLFNEQNNFVAGHASRKELSQAILSAASECMRAAHSALRFEYLNDVILLHKEGQLVQVIQPGAHSLAYAYSVSLPEIIQLNKASELEIARYWNTHQRAIEQLEYSRFKINLFEIADRFVARVKTNQLREIFWGSKTYSAKNNYPHFVG